MYMGYYIGLGVGKTLYGMRAVLLNETDKSEALGLKNLVDILGKPPQQNSGSPP